MQGLVNTAAAEAKLVVAFGVALILQGAKPVRLAAGAFLL